MLFRPAVKTFDLPVVWAACSCCRAPVRLDTKQDRKPPIALPANTCLQILALDRVAPRPPDADAHPEWQHEPEVEDTVIEKASLFLPAEPICPRRPFAFLLASDTDRQDGLNAFLIQ